VSTTQEDAHVAGADTRWEALYERLRDQIESGELPPGQKLPTERELMERENVSRNTVRSALAHLEQGGLIQTQLGRAGGRTVRSRVRIAFDMSKFELGAFVDDPSAGRDQWKLGVEAEGWVPMQVVAGVEILPAPAQLAEWLQLKPGDLLVRRRRLRKVSNPEQGIDWMVAMIADTWTPLDIAQLEVDGIAPLLSAQDVTLPGGIYHALGFRQVRFVDYIEARMPTDDETRLMQLPPGTPVGQHSRVGIDASGRRVRVLAQIWAGDRQVITYDMPVPERRLPSNGGSL
jgi:GntR family transcriptional regulator